MFHYTRDQLKNDINTGINGKIGMLARPDDFINQVVREVKNDFPIRSSKRSQALVPNLMSGTHRYATPADLHDQRIIDIPPQAKGNSDGFNIVSIAQFNTYPRLGDLAFDDKNGVRNLLIASNINSQTYVIDPTNDTTDWTATGEAVNLSTDTVDIINGQSSLSFDISSTPNISAGVGNNNLAPVDLSQYFTGHSSIFVWVKITDPTNITNFEVSIGNDDLNCYTKTTPAKFDNTPFTRGWNLLQFDMTTHTTIGTVNETTITYFAFIMHKDAAKINEIGYKINYPVFSRGVIHDILYYSKYGWVDTNGVWQQTSTNDLDLLVADDTEYDLFVKKGVALGMPLTNASENEVVWHKNAYDAALLAYGQSNPDESNVMVSTYHNQ